MTRLLRIALLIGLGLLLLEGALQLAAAIVAGSRRDVDAPWLADRMRVLCVGDSNTYGLYVEREETWPSRLEALWNARPEVPPIAVSNLGFPGMNSSRVLRDFPRALRAFEPDVVIVLLGANDFWTLPVPTGGADAAEGAAWWHRLRSARLLRAVMGATSELAIEAPENLAELRESGAGTARFRGETFELGWERARGYQSGARAALAANLRRLAELARASGAGVVFVTYASSQPSYVAASAELRSAAADTGARLVDVEALFTDLCRGEPCPELLHPDGHPTARGYAHVARALAERLAASGAR